MLLFHSLGALINAVVASILGVIVYIRNKKEPVNKIFSLFFVVVAIWGYAYFVWFFISDKATLLLVHRLFLTGASIFITILFFHSVLVFTKNIERYKKILIGGYLIFVGLFLIGLFTPLLVQDLEKKLYFEFWPTAGPLYFPFLIVWFFYLFHAIYLLVKEISAAAEEDEYQTYRTQLKYILAGTLIGFGGAVLNYPLWYNIPIPPITNFLVAIGMSVIAYGIIKHQIFNIKILVSETLTITIWIFTLIRTVLSKSYGELAVNIIFSVLTFLLGIFLIRSIYKESEYERKLLKKTKKELKEERALHEVFEEIAEERARQAHDLFMKDEHLENLKLKIKILNLAREKKELEKELEKKERKIQRLGRELKK